MKLPNKIALGIGAALSECIAEIIKFLISINSDLFYQKRIPISNLS